MQFKDRRPHPSRTIGDFASAKLDKSIRWENLLERDLLYRLEADPDVLSFGLRPFKVPIVSAGRDRRDYVPDVVVRRRHHTWLHAIEPDYQGHNPLVKARLERARVLVEQVAQYFET